MQIFEKYKKSDVPAEALAEFDAAGEHLGKGYQHFYKGARLSADALFKKWGGFDKATPKEIVVVFGIIKEIALERTRLTAGTIDRYLKICRYMLMYHVSWDIAAVANRDNLRRCKERAKELARQLKKDFRDDIEELMERAWLDIKAEDDATEEDQDRRKRERQARTRNERDDMDVLSALIFRVPLRTKCDHDDEFWVNFLEQFISLVDGNREGLKDGSDVQQFIWTMYGLALPIVAKAKAKKESA